MFDAIGGKTKFFAALYAVAQALEVTNVIPPGSMEVFNKLVEALASAGMVWGFRDAITKLKA